MPSVTSVSPVSGNLGEASASIYPVTLHQEVGGFLMSLLCVVSSVQKCHRHVQIVDMSDEHDGQSMRTKLF